jgi:membrane protein YdbS with pleckstrin-like domain
MYFLKSILYPEVFQISSLQWTVTAYLIASICVIIVFFLSIMSTYFVKSRESPHWASTSISALIIFGPIGIFFILCLEHDVLFRFDPIIITYLIVMFGVTVIGATIGSNAVDN